jgi:SAM-dependent methyltransferase
MAVTSPAHRPRAAALLELLPEFLRPRRGTPVEAYWGGHTVNSKPFQTAAESLAYLDWRFQEYPLFREFMDLYGDHRGHVVLDYGCGPGNDVVGFLEYSGAARVIGADISAKALKLARRRVALHAYNPARVQWLQVSDTDARIALPDASVDFIYCEGVLHHTSHPQAILAEFRRVLKPHGAACIMVYNRDSIWFHLYTAYDKMIVQGAFAGLTLEEAFARNTDGEHCPISRCYAPAAFTSLCEQAGFACDHVGGYLSRWEIDLLNRLGDQASMDERLGEEHRSFLRELVRDARGLPMHAGRHAGIGGVYRLRQASRRPEIGA